VCLWQEKLKGSMMPKFKVPEGTGNISIEGREYKPDKQGVVTIPNGVDLSSLPSFGCVPWEPAGGLESLAPKVSVGGPPSVKSQEPKAKS
jgi:hypothetical protein